MDGDTRVTKQNKNRRTMIKELSLLFGIVFLVCYLAFAFVNWDIVWVAHVDAVMRVTFVWFYVAICCMIAFIYLEIRDESK